MSKALLGAALLVGLGFCVFVNVVNAPDKAGRDARNRAAGDRIVAALNAFRDQHGRYPKTLTELTPALIDPLPQTETGGDAKPFAYDPDSTGAGYTLLYPEAPYGALPADAFFVYDSHKGQWALETR